LGVKRKEFQDKYADNDVFIDGFSTSRNSERER